jgi:hypothetical protein
MVLHEQAEPDFVREHDIDHVTLDIIENALKNIRHEMDRVLVTTAVSPVIREQADEFPLIADRKGRMVVGQFGSPVDTVLENSPYTVEDLKDGDVIALRRRYSERRGPALLLPQFSHPPRDPRRHHGHSRWNSRRRPAGKGYLRALR